MDAICWERDNWSGCKSSEAGPVEPLMPEGKGIVLDDSHSMWESVNQG